MQRNEALCEETKQDKKASQSAQKTNQVKDGSAEKARQNMKAQKTNEVSRELRGQAEKYAGKRKGTIPYGYKCTEHERGQQKGTRANSKWLYPTANARSLYPTANAPNRKILKTRLNG